MITRQVKQKLRGLLIGNIYAGYEPACQGLMMFLTGHHRGGHSEPWEPFSVDQWCQRIAWALKADHYMVFGSYDDVCDGINWGIADTSGTTVEYNKYPGDEPYVYYKILQEMLAKTAARRKGR